MSGLRVEERAAAPADAAKAEPEQLDLEHWRRLAVQSAERLSYAERQLKDLRAAADDARARMAKYKDRLDKANERVNDLNVALVTATADRDRLRGQLATQEAVARRVHEYRQSLLNGPLWDLFVELAVASPAAMPGVERSGSNGQG